MTQICNPNIIAYIKTVCFLLCLLVVGPGMALEIDPPGRPNEDASAIVERLNDRSIPLEARVAYFSHYNPVVRMAASKSVMLEGEKAVPFIQKALKSKS